MPAVTAAVPDIVVETAQLVAVALQQSGGVFLREILKLQQYIGPALLHGTDKHVHKLGVLIVADAWVTPAHIHGIVQMLLIIGTDIEHNRQGRRRVDPAAGGI